MEKLELKEGDILQINPTHEKYPGFFLIVTEPKSWGAQGYLMSFRDFDAVRYKEKAYLRVKFQDVEYCGHVTWVHEYNEEV